MTTRREVLIAAATTALALNATASAATGTTESPPKPLPFDPKKLRGLSERLLVSHWENNYGGAVKNLNKVREQLGTVTKDTPGFVVAGLKERELTFSNSRVLHEAYFDSLGGAAKPAGAIAKALAASFGGLDRFETLFRATAMSLAGGSGWVILGHDMQSGELGIAWSGNHTQTPAGATPLLVLDMYEHSYHIDFGAAAARYVDAFWDNIAWEGVEQRYEKALKRFKA
jgi:Fe-Mn family superoxide dismutase